jgi:hypothetical protein
LAASTIGALFRHWGKYSNSNTLEKRGKKQKKKTINSRYSLVVTHPTTNLPAHGLSTAERTGSPVFHVLWSIAEDIEKVNIWERNLSVTTLNGYYCLPSAHADNMAYGEPSTHDLSFAQELLDRIQAPAFC